MSNNCSNCDATFSDPVENFANYVRSLEWGTEEEVEVLYGLKHTSMTNSRLDDLDEAFPDRDRQILAAEAAHPNADDERDGVRFSIPQSLFDKVELDNPQEARDRDDIAFTISETERQKVPKTALLCPDCTDANRDTILWGVDS